MEKIIISCASNECAPPMPKAGQNPKLISHLKVNSFKRMFKGHQELDLAKIMKYSSSNDYIMLRPFERILVGTGISIVKMPDLCRIWGIPKTGRMLIDGIFIVNFPQLIVTGMEGKEVEMLLYNPQPFLNRVDIGMPFGTLISEDHFDSVEFIIKEDGNKVNGDRVQGAEEVGTASQEPSK